MRFVLKQNSNLNLSTRASVYLTMFLRKFKNLPLQDFPGEPLRRSASGTFPFHIFEPPRTAQKPKRRKNRLPFPLPAHKKLRYFLNSVIFLIPFKTI